MYDERDSGDLVTVGPYPSIDLADRVVLEVDWDDSVVHGYYEYCVELWSATDHPGGIPGVVTTLESTLDPWLPDPPSEASYQPIG